MSFDLHFHSDASDGEATLAALLAAARARPDLARLALADHDTLAASPAFAGADRRALVAVELTVAYGQSAPHLLGLGVDPADHGLASYLAARRIERHARFAAWGDALRSLGLRFEPDPALADRGLGKPHVVAELRRHPENAPLLPPPPPDASVSDPIYGSLLKVGGPADVSKLVPSTLIAMEQAIAMIRGARGLAVLAHPLTALYLVGQNRASATWQAGAARARERLGAWRAAGLDGLEVWAPRQEDAGFLAELLAVCAHLGLLATAGSDDHSADGSWLGRTGLPASEAAGRLAAFEAALVRRHA